MPTCWIVNLIYLALPNVETSKLRVRERVLHGGHNIPVADIERRFSRSLSNLLSDFSEAATSCLCFINNELTPVLVFEQNGKDRIIAHHDHYQNLLKEIEICD